MARARECGFCCEPLAECVCDEPEAGSVSGVSTPGDAVSVDDLVKTLTERPSPHVNEIRGLLGFPPLTGESPE